MVDKNKDIKIQFTDSWQVEESFYQAFQNCDIEQMKNIWGNTDEVVCIHPNSQRIFGYELIMASWEQIFAAQESVSIQISEPVYKLQENMAAHYIKEELFVAENKIASILATNIYQQTKQGWKMIAHHASPVATTLDRAVSPKLH